MYIYIYIYIYVYTCRAGGAPFSKKTPEAVNTRAIYCVLPYYVLMLCVCVCILRTGGAPYPSTLSSHPLK